MSHPLVVNIRSGAEFDVFVGRPSEWGNHWSHVKGSSAPYYVATREEAVAAHRKWLLADPLRVAAAKALLTGKRLGCYCSPLPCHADTLAEVANL